MPHDFFPKPLLVLNQKNTIQNSKSSSDSSSPNKDKGAKFLLWENQFLLFSQSVHTKCSYKFGTQMEEIAANIPFYLISSKSLMSLSKMKFYMSKRNKEHFVLQNNIDLVYQSRIKFFRFLYVCLHHYQSNCFYKDCFSNRFQLLCDFV